MCFLSFMPYMPYVVFPCLHVHWTFYNVRVYVSAKNGYEFELFHTTYTYATQIIARTYVHA